MMVSSHYRNSIAVSDTILKELGAPWSLSYELSLDEEVSRVY